jgi:hypothetical protein
MAFCPPASTHEEAGLLLVGTEGGQLLRCQVCVSDWPPGRNIVCSATCLCTVVTAAEGLIGHLSCGHTNSCISLCYIVPVCLCAGQ